MLERKFPDSFYLPLIKVRSRVQDLPGIGLPFLARVNALREEFKLRPPRGAVQVEYVPQHIQKDMAPIQVNVGFGGMGDRV